MVRLATSLGRSGVQDFVFIRASAVILASYVIFLVGYMVTTPELTYDIWRGLFENLLMKVFSLLALLALLVHAWIGMWQVTTDYIKPLGLRAAVQFGINVVLLAYVAAGAFVLWGV